MKNKMKKLYERMAETGCIACHLSNQKQITRTEIHHLRSGMGMSQKNIKCIPLCVDHHRGSKCGYHGLGRKRFEALYGSEEYLLKKWMEEHGEIDWDEYS